MGLLIADILQYQQKRRSRGKEHSTFQTDETREMKERKDEHQGIQQTHRAESFQ